MMNLSRYSFMIAVLLTFIFFVSAVSAKHIIVIYDVSKSMLRHPNRTYMGSEDIRRLNEYLTKLIFTNISQPLLDNEKDKFIEESGPMYAGRSLYEKGDILTYAEYAQKRYGKISREQVNRSKFQEQLPDPTNLGQAFHGNDSYLLRAKVDVYYELFKEEDDETYWIFVTDGDIDRSEGSGSETARILQQHDQIEKEFHSPRICRILFNDHVWIEVRRIQAIDAIFIANQTDPKTEIQRMQFETDDTGGFTSETLIINTENSQKAMFKLGSVTVKVVDKNGRPLQVASEDSNTKDLQIDSISLQGKSPPTIFRISLPAHPEFTNPENLLEELKISYSYNGVDRVHQVLPISYTAVIDSIYVSEGKPTVRSSENSLEEYGWQGKELELRLSDDTYLGELVVESESRNKQAFQINEILCYIQDENGQKLCDASVPRLPATLGESFQIVVPKDKRLDWFGNKLALEIKYQYAETTKTVNIAIPFKLLSNGGFPIWLLIILLFIPLGLLLFFIIPWVRGLITSDPVEIRLAEIDGDGIEQNFTLRHKTSLEFGPGDDDTFRLNVGSSALLRCLHGSIWLYENAQQATAKPKEGKILNANQTLTLKKRDSDEEDISISFEIIGDELQVPPDTDIEEDDQPPY